MANFPPAKSDARRLLAELEVEPLSEARWSKIEQAVYSRLDRGAEAPSAMLAEPPWRRPALAWWAAAAAMAACALVAALLWLSGAQPALSRISTGVSASHVVLPGVVLDVGPDSAVVVSGSSTESQLLVLDRGEVTCDVARRRAGAPFLVQAGEVRIEVIGTRFSVVRRGESARVAVQEGVVKVSARGRSVHVAAGQSWPPATVAAAAVAAAASEPAAAAPPAAAPELTSAVRPRAAARRAPEARLAPREPSLEVRSLQADFEAAARLEARSPAESIRRYRELATGTSSWAQNALFAQGRLEAARGNRGEARRVLQQYLARFPSGPNADDARSLLQRME